MKRKRDGNATEDIKSIRKSMKSVRLFFPLLLTLILNLSLPVFASQNISLPENVSEVNIQKTGSIEIELTDGEEGTSKEGVIFHYSKVAEIVDGQYELVEQYKGSGIDLNAIEYAEELDEAAEKLSYYKASDEEPTNRGLFAVCVRSEELRRNHTSSDCSSYMGRARRNDAL